MDCAGGDAEAEHIGRRWWHVIIQQDLHFVFRWGWDCHGPWHTAPAHGSHSNSSTGFSSSQGMVSTSLRMRFIKQKLEHA